MTRKKLLQTQAWTRLASSLFAVGGLVLNAQAQSSGALLDKLVQKGILTVKEADELREEAQKDLTKATAKTGLPDWVTSLKFTGDFRGRYEAHYVDNPAFVDRHRLRYRFRLATII